MIVNSIQNTNYQPKFNANIIGTPSIKYAAYHAEDLVNSEASILCVKDFCNAIAKICKSKEAGDVFVTKSPKSDFITVREFSKTGRIGSKVAFSMPIIHRSYDNQPYSAEGYSTMEAIIAFAERITDVRDVDMNFDNIDIIKTLYKMLDISFDGFDIRRK